MSTMLVRVLFLCMGRAGENGIKIPDIEISHLVIQKSKKRTLTSMWELPPLPHVVEHHP